MGYALTDKVRDTIAKVPATAWQPAITADGEPESTVTSSRPPACSSLWRFPISRVGNRKHSVASKGDSYPKHSPARGR